MDKNRKRKVKLRITKTKHLICSARINGIKAVLLVDTVASSSCIALSKKENFNIKEKGDPFEAAGAGKDKVKAVLGHQCDLILGKYSVRKHAFVLLDMQHINATLEYEKVKPIDGILGADFLKKNRALIDYNSRTLTL